MNKYEFHFEESFQLEVNGNLYAVDVTGLKVRSEGYASGLGYDTELKSVIVCDLFGDEIDTRHEDYKDVINEIYEMDFEVEYQAEESSDYQLN